MQFIRSFTGDAHFLVSCYFSFRKSYNAQIKAFRKQVPNYKPQRDLSQDFSKLHFYYFDGNQVTSGKLSDDAIHLVCQAYGLHGVQHVAHENIISKAIADYKCSQTAIQALLYGSDNLFFM